MEDSFIYSSDNSTQSAFSPRFLCSLFMNKSLFIITWNQIVPFHKATHVLSVPWHNEVMHMHETSRSVILGKALTVCVGRNH